MKLRWGADLTVVVTGATGMLGSHVVDELLRRGQSVRALVRDPGKAARLRERGIETLVGDMREPKSMADAVGGADVVYHCAAAADDREVYRTNHAGVHNLLDAVRATGKGRLVLLTGINVLGMRNFDPATEELPCRRTNDPGTDVKIELEKLALAYNREHNVDVTILRPGFICSPRDRRNMPALIDAVRNGSFCYIGSRRNIVPIVHYSDMVQAMLLAGEAPLARGRVYHIADGSRTTIEDLVTCIAECLGCPAPTRVLPYALPYMACVVVEWVQRLHLRRAPGPITRSGLHFLGTSRFVDIRRARQELGYAPRVTLREGIAATVVPHPSSPGGEG